VAGSKLRSALVTGALGFIGGELTRSLSAEGRDVTLLVRDGKQVEAERKFPGAKEIVTLQELAATPAVRVFDTIFHLATVYMYENAVGDIPKMIEGNITLPATLADIAARWGSKVTFVNVSTYMQHFQGDEYFPTCLYAATKKSIEDILSFYTNTIEAFSTSHIVFPNIFGEGDTRVKLLNLLINATQSRSPLRLASGRQLLDLVHVSDAITALKSAEDLGYGRWSIGSDLPYSIKELTELTQEISGVRLDIDFDERRDRKFDTFEIWETADRLPGWLRTIDPKQWLAKQLKNPERVI
jgi:nucleoside-diphosphate-sugar epimerase